MAYKKLSYIEKQQHKRERRQVEKIYKQTNYGRADKPLSLSQFKKRVQATKEGLDLSAKEAARKVAFSETYVDPYLRSRINFVSGMKKHYKEAYEFMIKNRSRTDGKFMKMTSDLIWDKESKSYMFGKNWAGQSRYLIVTDKDRSPASVKIIDLETGDTVLYEEENVEEL